MQKTLNYKGLPIILATNPINGGWQGYVGIPKGNAYYEADYDDVNVNVHGGVTFGGFIDDNNDSHYYFGWDSCHYGDTPEEFTQEKAEEITKAFADELIIFCEIEVKE